MTEHEATEIAYKNGYEQGRIDAVKEMRSEIKRRCTEGGIYPAFVARVVDEVEREIAEGAPVPLYSQRIVDEFAKEIK
jgi:hypothetical protein